MAKPLHIFRAGTHTTADGQDVTFTESDLAASAAAYNPSIHEAPLVAGHPTHDAPAYGWVGGLAASVAGLTATPREVDPAFAEAVAAGRYKKLSASFYHPDSKANPVPGVYYLRHVGFLGAMPPAVKGLAPVEFAGGEDDFVTLEFSEDVPEGFLARLASVLRSLRDYIIDKDGLETADKVIPAWEMDWLQEDAAKAQTATGDSTAFAENKENTVTIQQKTTRPGVDLPQAKVFVDPGLDARIRAIEAREIAFAERERKREAETVVNAAIAAGRLTAPQAAGLVEFMAALPEARTVSFGEGDKATTLPTPAFICDFLARLPKQVDFTEASAPDLRTADGLTPEEVANRAVSFRERQGRDGIAISVTDAVAAVKAGKDKEHSHGKS